MFHVIRPESLLIIPSSTMPIQQQQRGTRRRAPIESIDKKFSINDSTMIADGSAIPCRRARLNLRMNKNKEEQKPSTEKVLITNYPDSSSCDIINQINFHEEQHLIKEDNKWSKKQEPIGDIYDDVMMMTNSLQKESNRWRTCVTEKVTEPILEDNHLLCSSSRMTLAPLSGSYSCANLDRLTTPTPSSHSHMYISCSSNALDQLQSTEPTKLFDYLFLGSQKDALDAKLLEKYGITRVINLSESCPRPSSLSDDPRYFLRIAVNDTYSAKLLPYFETAYQFIGSKKANERVLMHCLAGISRSPTLAIAYVMREKGLGNEEAYSFVKSRRPSISPNFNFLGQLWEYERQLRHQHILPPPSPLKSMTSEQQPQILTEKPSTTASDDSIFNDKKEIITGIKPLGEFTSEHQPKKNAPIARPRQLITSFGSRFSCPPSLANESDLLKRTLNTNDNIPSPSNEFSRLDISLANPCFGMDFPNQQPKKVSIRRKLPLPLLPLISTSIMAENPVFSSSAGLRDHMGESTGSLGSSSGISSVSNSFCCSTESAGSSTNDSFSSFSSEDYGIGITRATSFSYSTRNCLTDTDGDELVRLGPMGSQQLDEYKKEDGELDMVEQNVQRAMDSKANKIMPKWRDFGFGANPRKKIYYGSRRKCDTATMLSSGQIIPQQYTGSMCRNLHTSANVLNCISTCKQKKHPIPSKFQQLGPCFKHHRKNDDISNETRISTPEMAQKPSTSYSPRPKLAKSLCIDRLLGVNQMTRNPINLFRQSLPTIGDDRKLEEEEEKKGSAENEEDGIEKTNKCSKETESTDGHYNDHDRDRSSISSSSSHEIPVQ